jgi:hypothetical protein
MRRERYRSTTIRAALRTPKAVCRRHNIVKPEELKAYARANSSENQANKTLGDLDSTSDVKFEFYRPLGLGVKTSRFIPLESELIY